MHTTTWRLRAFIALTLMLAMAPLGVKAQRVALKTNALEYLILEPNLTLEARLSRTISVQLGVSVCPVDKKIFQVRPSNVRIEPEVRYWFNRPMARHFVAVSASAVDYSLVVRDTHFVGDAVGLGVSYGYALVLSRHWNMEVEAGIGLASIKAKKYHSWEEQPQKSNISKISPVPIRLALNFSYIFE